MWAGPEAAITTRTPDEGHVKDILRSTTTTMESDAIKTILQGPTPAELWSTKDQWLVKTCSPVPPVEDR